MTPEEFLNSLGDVIEATHVFSDAFETCVFVAG